MTADAINSSDPSRLGKFCALINHELQYSLWNADLPIPDGWKQEGDIGEKDEVLAYIERVWTDMRPLSVRQQLEELAKQEVH
jgi:MbtH protein